MFESLADRLQAVFKKLGGKGRLGEEDVREAMKQVRLALLEADVNLQVVRDFVAKVSERAVGEEVSRSLTPSQQVIKIVRNELVSLLGDAEVPLADATLPPTVIMLVGLQGAGKTTHASITHSCQLSAGDPPTTQVVEPRALATLTVQTV